MTIPNTNTTTRKGHLAGRAALGGWSKSLQKNIYTLNPDFQHSIHYYFTKDWHRIHQELEHFGELVACTLDALVAENDNSHNLPRLDAYDSIGNRCDEIVHHSTYMQAGNLIYGSKMMEKVSQPGMMLESLALFFLSSHAGEAGHNCPLACTAGILRVLRNVPDFPEKSLFLEKLIDPSYETNFTGAQFVTEIQGGSDVGLNDTLAYRDSEGQWRVQGEKWFCSNANAELFLITARFDESVSGTKGVGLFLAPIKLPNGQKNHYSLRRLKEKLGTRTMATGEVDFHDSYVYPMGKVEDGFKMLMDNVIHLSRIYNTFATLGAGRRAYQIALEYVKHRIAFGQTIFNYPLVKENLARIKTENSAMLASIMATTRMQDQYDCGEYLQPETPLLLRLLANLNKYISALWSVDHVHHSIDMLGGNGTIENFSSLPRLLRDSIVFENWEGTHNTLRMQILRDILKYKIDDIYLDYVDQKIVKILGEEEWIQPIQNKLKTLRQQLIDFKVSSSEVQSLQIKAIVHQMALVYCSLSLFLEGVHQKETTNTTSKLDCLRYFYLLHFQRDKIVYDERYINLIAKIVES